MKIRFTKMHGAGNDYIYIDCFKAHISEPEKLAIEMSPRHMSVGSDGLVLICPSDKADAKMRMFNLDGSEGMMCGNAIRCVAKYLYDNGIVKKDKIDIETLSGIKKTRLFIEDGKVGSVSVRMGKARFEPEYIHLSEDREYIDSDLKVGKKIYKVTTLSMGNPHCVLFVDDVDKIDIEKIGPQFENHTLFAQRVNTEFIEYISPKYLKMRVWERGSGETWACGTGACAAVAAAVKNGKCHFNDEVEVILKGGSLYITVHKDYSVIMRGPAVKVYEGVFGS